MKQERQILCPRCEYRPRAEDRWACVPSCGTSWHTFWTAGICPGCAVKWPVTQCPACQQVSPHRDWYRQPADSPALEETRELERLGG
jgi:hypothetical protein